MPLELNKNELKNLFEFLRRVNVNGDEAHLLVALQQKIGRAMHPEVVPAEEKPAPVAAAEKMVEEGAEKKEEQK